jgi:hypothetical protein
MDQELEIEETPCEVTERDMKALDNPNSKAWRRVTPEEYEAGMVAIRARNAAREARRQK